MIAFAIFTRGCADPASTSEDAGSAAPDASTGDVGDGGPGAEDAGAIVDAEADATAEAPPLAQKCPADMVRVARRFCVDRFEAMLVDAATALP